MNSFGWAGTKYDRNQHMLIPPSIDDMIPAGHKIRNLEEVLFNIDWSDWESEYNLDRGQPPIHPRLVAGAILYGLTERIRSSRDLEKACSFRTDFIWFLSGRKIDHSTFASFRTRFTVQLHELFKQITLVALNGKVKIDLAIDGTRIRANSSRSGALTEERIKKRALTVGEDLIKALDEMEHQDMLESPDSATKAQLQKAINKLEKHKTNLAEALDAAKKRNELKRKDRGASATLARVPITDTDSYIIRIIRRVVLLQTTLLRLLLKQKTASLFL